ncbi:MAG: DUF1624 domain-containing protein [Christensenellaceae bacterium]|jgi:uncharacterized membrane protein|nr:DUF1624 domain-containing protein [Christensenellaceae bacterium]
MISSKKVSKRLGWRARAWEIDFLRGISILLVAFDHAMFDMAYLFGDVWRDSGVPGLIDAQKFARAYDNGWLKEFWWPVFVIIFFVVSGICITFSRNNFKRGLKIGMVAVFLTIATYLLENYAGVYGITIYFGVLHCMAASILIISLISAFLDRIPNMNRILKAVVFLVIGIVVVLLYDMYFPPIGNRSPSLTSKTDILVLGVIFHVEKFWWLTADYFPLVPYIGYFSFGTAIGLVLYDKKKSLIPKLNGPWHMPFTLPGRHSAFIYLGVRAIDIAILALITYVSVGTLF